MVVKRVMCLAVSVSIFGARERTWCSNQGVHISNLLQAPGSFRSRGKHRAVTRSLKTTLKKIFNYAARRLSRSFSDAANHALAQLGYIIAGLERHFASREMH